MLEKDNQELLSSIKQTKKETKEKRQEAIEVISQEEGPEGAKSLQKLANKLLKKNQENYKLIEKELRSDIIELKEQDERILELEEE